MDHLPRRLGLVTLLATLAAGGCTMCQDCYDDAPPVIGASTPASGQRSGSILAEKTDEGVQYASETSAEADKESFVR